MVSKINFPPLNNLYECSEEASGALNLIKKCFTLGDESLLKMVSVKTKICQEMPNCLHFQTKCYLCPKQNLNLFWFTLDNFLFPV